MHHKTDPVKSRISADEVRPQMKSAMINGLASKYPKNKAYRQSIPRIGEAPTPEEFVAYNSGVVRKKVVL